MASAITSPSLLVIFVSSAWTGKSSGSNGFFCFICLASLTNEGTRRGCLRFPHEVRLGLCPNLAAGASAIAVPVICVVHADDWPAPDRRSALLQDLSHLGLAARSLAPGLARPQAGSSQQRG